MEPETDKENKSNGVMELEVDKTNKTNGQQNEETADFEKAMEATGFGLFNFILLLVIIPATTANTFASSTMSYILPEAECDLRLSLQDKGILNASAYAGMIMSAVFWGYLSDTQGRRKILAICYLIDSVCVFLSSLSQNKEMLILFKFLDGTVITGPSAILYTYITEMHNKKYHSHLMMYIGVVMSLSTILIPLLAWGIFPRDWDFVLFGGLNVYSWQIFLFFCCLPSLICGLLMTLLPETPKFLMAQGRNAEALQTFQKIYALNKRQPRENYPFKQLVEEVPSRDGNANEVVFTVDTANLKDKIKSQRPHRTFTQAIRDGMQQIKPLFHKPLLGHAIHVVALQFCVLLSVNTIRLWLPQLFASISEYEALDTPDKETGNLCTILEYSVNKTAAVLSDYEEKCANRTPISIDMYINNMIVAAVGVVGYSFGSTILKVLGEKVVMSGGLFVSSLLAFGLYWSVNSMSTLVISSIYLTVASLAIMSLLGSIVIIFPTTLRTLVISISLMFGRLGALTGNVVFPSLMEIGCLPPFLMVGIVMLCASALSFLLPNTKKRTFT